MKPKLIISGWSDIVGNDSYFEIIWYEISKRIMVIWQALETAKGKQYACKAKNSKTVKAITPLFGSSMS